ncbi:hypothetical protein QVD17_17230 [Tagetes erecta]|uniref:t-SNARE coiled-coil homology domain-containing protein n=1 Tax=Tagetes erecta TaxID=13708 RepID=A0AAD8KY03_TARER|nr:hypothetical protein QVD17_17230 [Tagetes erecta]
MVRINKSNEVYIIWFCIVLFLFHNGGCSSSFLQQTDSSFIHVTCYYEHSKMLLVDLSRSDIRDVRGNRSALFDDIEDGGIRATSSYSSHEIDEQENDRAVDGLQDRVLMLKRLTGDIHEEVEGHNRMLDRMGNDMDSSRGILSGTMDKFKTVFETKSSRRMFTLVASFVVGFLVIYYLTRNLVEMVICVLGLRIKYQLCKLYFTFIKILDFK